MREVMKGEINWFKYGGGAFNKVVENMERWWYGDYKGPGCVATCNSSPGHWPKAAKKKVWFGGHNYNVFLKNRIKDLSAPDLIVGFSPFCAQTFRDLGYEAHDGFLGVDTGIYYPDRGKEREKFTFLSNCWCEGYGVGLLLEGWRKAWPEMINTELVIKTHFIGNDDLADLKRKISGMEGVRIWEPTGWSLTEHELAKYYNSGDCFISTVPSGGSSLTILEAMACGLPVIAPKYSGYASFITPKTGYEVKYKLEEARFPHLADGAVHAIVDTDDLAKQIVTAYNDGEAFVKKGKRAAGFVTNNHTWGKAARHFHRIVEENL